MQKAIHAGFQILEHTTYEASYVKWWKSKDQMNDILKNLEPKTCAHPKVLWSGNTGTYT